jgi:glycosyltransferase involved in cell wall biosynthesis
MRKVLMVAPTPFFSDRGCHIRIYEEARWLKRLGAEVKIVTYSAGQDLPEMSAARAKGLISYRKLEAGPSLRKPFADLSLLWKAREEIKDYKPGVVHCHLHEGAFIGLLSSAGVPVVLDYQGSLAGELNAHQAFFRLPLVSHFMAAVESGINRGVDGILLNCESLIGEIEAKVRGKCRLAGDGVDVERFRPQPAEPALRAQAGLKEGLPVIVYLGLLNYYQGVDLLLDSAVMLKNRGVKFQMLVMGYPLGNYPARVKNSGLEDWVRFTGRTDYFQAHRWLALGDIAAAPKISRSESNGKILNYLGMGLPLVCFDRAVNRELAGDCAAHVKFVNGDGQKNARSFADAMANLLESPSRRRELSEKGRQRAVEQFSWEAVAKRTLKAYEEWGA